MSQGTAVTQDLAVAEDGQFSVKLKREATDTIAEAAAVVADEALDSEVGQPSTINVTDEATILHGLTEGFREQGDLERDISNQANIALTEQEDERDNKRMEKAKRNREKLLKQKEREVRKILSTQQNILQRRHIDTQITRLDEEIAALDDEIVALQARITARHVDDGEVGEAAESGNKRQPNETQRNFLIRTGKITPFSRLSEPDATLGGELGRLLMEEEDALELQKDNEQSGAPQSHRNLRLPGFSEGSAIAADSEFSLRSGKKRRLSDGEAPPSAKPRKRTRSLKDPSAVPALDVSDYVASSESDAVSIKDEDFSDESTTENLRPVKKTKQDSRRAKSAENGEDLDGVDDGNENSYQARLSSWVSRRSRARHQKQLTVNAESPASAIEPDGEEWFKPSPDGPDHELENGLKLPGDVHPSLFDYQKTGVQWLGELYEQQVGGIIGDEMGLGKTIQIIAFLAALHYSRKLTRPVIVVAPATVLRQWVNEFHRWWPPLRVSILHTSGSGMFATEEDSRLDEQEFGNQDQNLSKGLKAAKRIVDRVIEHGHVLVTTYKGIETYKDILIPIHWDFAVLDEGHKIRNPNTQVTVYCKELQTPNRVILSGTPMQNNLVELWSLFDFVYPMRLGTLVDFRNQFELPIKLGGYASASTLQIMTAQKCAETLKDAISPYLLQRFKVDVAADLPKKSERVLFCKLTKPQREAYEMFLASDGMKSIFNGSRKSLYGIDILRKICNHPDLLDPDLRQKMGYKWGNPHKSGKMQVVQALLQVWKNAGDKILLFSQGIQMLNVIENFVQNMPGFSYLRMDGTTNIKDRQTMVDKFNTDPELNVFLLTTKVGGLGVNLTGANRVIIFDPDWNPSTDIQARERAWRLGQKKEVTIYRLMTAGTIEEKIYHRQIFKQFLSDKILKDPTQRQAFHMKDLHDLFTLGSSDNATTETGNMFKGTETFGRADTEDNDAGKSSFVSSHGWGSETGDPGLILPPSMGLSKGGATARVAFHAATQRSPYVAPPDTVAEEDIRAIAGVSKLEEYRGEGSDMKGSVKEEDRILEGLFARSGVHSVLEHDQIINGRKKVQADRGMLEREAQKVAREAAAQLRRSGHAARQVPIGTVTWTGEVGTAGRPQNIRRGAGPSSSGILSNLAARQNLNNGRGSESSTQQSRDATAVADQGPRAKEFMSMVPHYFKAHGGVVPSQMLLVHFGHMCQTEVQKSEFTAVLKEVATLRAGGGSRKGRWHLKDEFK